MVRIRRGFLLVLVLPLLNVVTAAAPAAADECDRLTDTDAYADCSGSSVVPLGLINDNNWDFGPRTYALIFNNQIIGKTSNYIHVHTAGREAENDDGYISWVSGPAIKQQIYVRIYDDTIGATVRLVGPRFRIHSL